MGIGFALVSSSMSSSGPGPTYVKVSSTVVARARKFYPRPIGFHGRHDHGRAPDDPVYKTKSIPFSLKPKCPIDWRGPGRTVLCTGMAMLESPENRLRSPGQIMDWQAEGFCSERCLHQCSKSQDRIFCAMRVPGTRFELLNKLDGVLMSYKGTVETRKPIFSVHRRIAARNRFHSVNYRVGKDGLSLVSSLGEKDISHPAFGLHPELASKRVPEEELYDEDADVEKETPQAEDPEERKIEQTLLDYNC